MNTCDNVSLYLYNEMTEAEKTEFQKHLQRCAQCSEAVKIFNAATNAKELKSAPLQVINAIFEKTTRKRHIFAFTKTMKLTFAAACLLIGVGYFTFNKPVPNAGFLFYDSSAESFEEIASISSELDEYESIFFA